MQQANQDYQQDNNKWNQEEAWKNQRQIGRGTLERTVGLSDHIAEGNE